MTLSDNLQTGFKKIMDCAGRQLVVKVYTETIGSVWDDDVTLTHVDTHAAGVSISGTFVPDATGVYYESGTYNSKPVYSQGVWSLYYQDAYNPPWLIGSTLGGTINIWGSTSASGTFRGIAGTYTGSAIGTEVAAEVSNDKWASGIVLPINAVEGTKDFLLMQQGKLSPTDMRLFVSGNIALGGSDVKRMIQLGSPTGDSYMIVDNGVIGHQAGDVSIFNKAYIRRLTNGSFIG